MPNTYKTDPVVLSLALKVKKRLDERERAYREECERDYRNGHRPHYCIHGTNQWTDYDNICGPCEDSLTVYEEALMVARRAVNESERRRRTMRAFTQALTEEGYRGNDIMALLDPIIDWVLDPIKEA